MSEKRRRRIRSAMAFAAAVSVMSSNALSVSASAETAASVDDLLSNVGEALKTALPQLSRSFSALLLITTFL